MKIKPIFIQCNTPSITYLKDAIVINDPVNIAICTTISKSLLKWYPDNSGKPTIKFNGCKCSWTFINNDDRDAEFKRILNLFK